MFCATVEFDSKDLVQDLNRLLQFAPGSQPNAAILREFSNKARKYFRWQKSDQKLVLDQIICVSCITVVA